MERINHKIPQAICQRFSDFGMSSPIVQEFINKCKNNCEIVVNSKSIPIFGVLLTRTSNDAISTETKTKRKPTVASTEVSHTHCVCVGSRDFLPLFNQKSFKMLPTNDERANGTPKAISAETILQDLLETNDISHFRQDLRSMADHVLLSDEGPESRRSIYCSYSALDTLLSNIEKYNLQKKIA
jgi:hypothetical protein